ncbi:hypothetical protein EST38_g14167 [Candolleomyces aberdarensis]|uniref:Uncharacterized protein n=1 Tax=Candolleomyces aberdarensis TaxID=2316362 RepID=A0A4V1Q1I3_9AGAR|nr:hypothetical protein EST38_g14167 [Candolleomyces aberdarensis]
MQNYTIEDGNYSKDNYSLSPQNEYLADSEYLNHSEQLPFPSRAAVEQVLAFEDGIDSSDESSDESGNISQGQAIVAPRSRSLALSYRDLLPSSQIIVAADGFNDSSTPFKTRSDDFGQFRVYPAGRLTYSPDALFTLGHFSDGAGLQAERFPGPPPPDDDNSGSLPAGNDFIDLFGDGGSTGLLLHWHYSPTTPILSKARTDSLVKDVILHPRFRAEDFKGFTMDKALEALDKHEITGINNAPPNNHWQSQSVQILVPCDRVSHTSEDAAPKYTVSNIQIRPIMETIRTAFVEPISEFFHLAGYESWVDTPGGPARQYDEIYTSDAFLEEQARLTEQVRAQGSDQEVVVAALLLGSDSTRLSKIGTQTLWPIYLYFGNLSKYACAKPSTFSAHHIAYIPKLPNDFQDWYKKTFGKHATAEMLAHIRKELFHAIWTLLLDDELRHTYLHGEEMQFWDLNLLCMYQDALLLPMSPMPRLQVKNTSPWYKG